MAMPVVFVLAALAAGSPAPVDLEADLGFGGWIVPGVWMPLRVEIGSRDALDGELVVSTGAGPRPQITWRHPVTLGPGARQRLHLDVIIDDPRDPVVVSIRNGGTVVAKAIPTGALRAAEGVVIGVTEEAAGLEIVGALPRRLRPAYLRESQLPVRWQDYEGVALVVVHDLDDAHLLPAQREALIQWVAQGGRLLVTGGESPAVSTPWLLDLLPADPGAPATPVVLRALTGSSRPVPVIEITPRRGATRVSEGGTIVSARRQYGRGAVTLWAFDPLAPAARAWATRRRLWSDLLETLPGPPVASADLGRVLPASQSLSGRAQLGVAALTALYIFAVRYAQRRWLPVRAGWLVLLVVILTFGSLMYAYAATARGSAIAATQVTVIETLPGLRTARATTYVSVANPYGGRYRLEAPREGALRPVDRIPVTYLGSSSHLAASGAGRGLVFESLQMLPHPAVARMVGREDGAGLIVHTGPGVNVSSPALFLRGRIYPLPDFREQLSLVLDPTKWEGVGSRAPDPADLRSQIRSALYARLRESMLLRDRPWFVGWVTDLRPRVTLSDASAAALQLLVVEAGTDMR